MNHWMEDFDIPDDFFVGLAERWYQIISPELTTKDPADLVTQMTLVSLEDAAQLRKWYDAS